MHEGDPARSETVPTLEDICVDLIRRHIDRVDDLGPVPDQIVRRLLLHPYASVGSPPRAPTLPAKLTPDVLERVESGTFAGSGRDLAPVTDAVWREFLRRDFPGVTVPPDASNKSAFRRLTAARRRRQADAAARLRATYADAARKKTRASRRWYTSRPARQGDPPCLFRRRLRRLPRNVPELKTRRTRNTPPRREDVPRGCRPRASVSPRSLAWASRFGGEGARRRRWRPRARLVGTTALPVSRQPRDGPGVGVP